MMKAGVNQLHFSFSWSVYCLGKATSISRVAMDSLYENGIYIRFHTPAWLDKKYPEAKCELEKRPEIIIQVRHNTYVSPEYQTKTALMDKPAG